MLSLHILHFCQLGQGETLGKEPQKPGLYELKVDEALQPGVNLLDFGPVLRKGRGKLGAALGTVAMPGGVEKFACSLQFSTLASPDS